MASSHTLAIALLIGFAAPSAAKRDNVAVTNTGKLVKEAEIAGEEDVKATQKCSAGWYRAVRSTEFCVASHKATRQCATGTMGCHVSGSKMGSFNPLTNCGWAYGVDHSDLLYVTSACVWYKTTTKITNIFAGMVCPSPDLEYCGKDHNCDNNFVGPQALSSDAYKEDITPLPHSLTTTCSGWWDSYRQPNTASLIETAASQQAEQKTEEAQLVVEDHEKSAEEASSHRGKVAYKSCPNVEIKANEEPPNMIYVTILEAQNLPSSWSDKVDPYVRFWVDDQEMMGATPQVNNNANPVFQWGCYFTHQGKANFDAEVMDQDFGSSNDLVGGVSGAQGVAIDDYLGQYDPDGNGKFQVAFPLFKNGAPVTSDGKQSLLLVKFEIIKSSSYDLQKK